MHAALPPGHDMTDPNIEGEWKPLDQHRLLRLVGYNCRRVHLRIAPLFMERMAQYELRQVDYTILTLANINPDLNQKRLAQAIHVSPPNLTPLLDRLEKRGLLNRKRNPADKRSQVLALTDAGKNLCGKADQTALELENEATAALANDELAELLRLLQKIFLRNEER